MPTAATVPYKPANRCIYLHGFASSPRSRKAVYLKDRFAKTGIKLEIPDLNQGDFTHLTLTRQITQTAALFNNFNIPITLIGSSFGGLTSAWLAEKYTQVQKLILLAPAFGFPSSWFHKFPQAELKQWQESGYKDIYHYGKDKLLPLHYEFLRDGNQYDTNKLKRSLPTIIIHGKNDDVVPIEVSHQYISSHSTAKLIALDSDHGLNDVQEIIWQEIQDFC
ncbi:conserved hypothetical protein [Hyella patelloides LEGE 07179]|uniref:Esterase n=1 Tax=Hyella patelloides LEGE 07179 TaxID=945734 RepID=A0A563VXD7_9CYAN|nr:YqiA/YcfP family alpha/beta fold hydrolase [Hyella patelloides]VEP16124.1 conserved hypothetical protein [Hyella patelloides LEGE 07179]